MMYERKERPFALPVGDDRAKFTTVHFRVPIKLEALMAQAAKQENVTQQYLVRLMLVHCLEDLGIEVPAEVHTACLYCHNKRGAGRKKKTAEKKEPSQQISEQPVCDGALVQM